MGSRKYSFKNKTVLITGGTKGLGLAMARRMAGEGAKLVLLARNEAELEGACDELALRRSPLLVRRCDITSPEQVQDVVQEVQGRFGRVDVLINNAGVIHVGPAEAMTEEDFRQSIETHFWGPFHMIRAVLPDLIRGRGRLVNISSLSGKIAIPHLLTHAAGKFALTGLSEGLTTELAAKGIKVTTVCPGPIRTGTSRRPLFKGLSHKDYDWFGLADSLPFLSLSAEKAAEKIVEACRVGKREVYLSLLSSLAIRMHGALPEVTLPILAWINRRLPEAEPTPLPTHLGEVPRVSRFSLL